MWAEVTVSRSGCEFWWSGREGYCIGKKGSRKIEEATYDDVAFRVLSCNQQPDHDSIAEFRKRHLNELGKLFVQVVELCERAGLVKLGDVALDGTKIKANAAKRKSLINELRPALKIGA